VKHMMTIITVMGLCACGGSGSGIGAGSGTPPSGNLSSAPGESALANYLQGAHQYTLNAVDGSGNDFTIQLASQPNAGTTLFNGEAPAYGTQDTLALSENGTLVANSITTGYYLLNPYMPLGTVYATGTPYGLVTSSTPFPATLNVGDTGPVDNLTYYHDSTEAIIDGYETGTYSVVANNSTTLLMCLNFALTGVTAQGTADGLADSTETDCYSVDTAGNAALVSIALLVNGATLTFM